MLSRSEEKLNTIRSDIGSLKNSVIKAANWLFCALSESRSGDFLKAKDELKLIDERANMIDNEIIASLALFGAEARDLRELVAYLKITNEIVRIADNIRGFAKHANENGKDFELFKDSFAALCKSSLNALNYALCDNDKEGAEIYRKTKVEESKSDDLYSILAKNIFKEFGANMDENHIRLLNLARKLEKLADRAAAIAKLVMYAKSGGELKVY